MELRDKMMNLYLFPNPWSKFFSFLGHFISLGVEVSIHMVEFIVFKCISLQNNQRGIRIFHNFSNLLNHRHSFTKTKILEILHLISYSIHCHDAKYLDLLYNEIPNP